MNKLHRKDGTFKMDEFVFRVDSSIVDQQVARELTAKYYNLNKEKNLENLGLNENENSVIRRVAEFPNYNKSWDEKGQDVVARYEQSVKDREQRLKDLAKKFTAQEEYYMSVADNGFTEEVN